MIQLLFVAAWWAYNATYGRAVALISEGQFQQAIPILQAESARQPSNPRIWKALGVAYASLSRYNEAEDAFARACKLAPKLAGACYFHARALYALDRFDASLAALTNCDSRDPQVQLARAQALEGLGGYAEAEPEFRKAFSSDPSAGVGLGRFLIRQGRFEEAIAPLEAAAAKTPGSAEARTHLGRALLETGRVGEAVRQLEAAVAAAPSSAQAHVLLARAYTRLGRSQEAQAHLNAAASAQ